MFAMSDEFDGLVRPGKREKWFEVKERWFCKTSDCKIPGKLKIGKVFCLSFYSSNYRKGDLYGVVSGFIAKKLSSWRLWKF